MNIHSKFYKLEVMKITYYKSAICPRCIPTNRFLKKIKEEHPYLDIEEIEVLTHLKRAKEEGVRSIPLIVVGDRRYYGVPPKREFEEIIRQLNSGN